MPGLVVADSADRSPPAGPENNLPPQGHRNYNSRADETHEFEQQPKHGFNTVIGLTTDP